MFCLWLSLPSALATQMYCAAQLASQHQAMYVIKWLHHRLLRQPQLHSFFIFCYFLLISIFSFFYCTYNDFWHLASLTPSHPLNEICKKLLIVWYVESATASVGTFSKIFVVGYIALLSSNYYLRQFWSEDCPDVFIGVINAGILY
jgi:hypothetical protein